MRYLFLFLTFSFASGFAQKMALTMESPIISNLKALPLNLEAGSFAEYQVTESDGSIYTHVFKVHGSSDQKNDLIRVSATKQGNGTSTMFFSVDPKAPDFKNAKDYEIKNNFGQFAIDSVSSVVLEEISETDQKETVETETGAIEAMVYTLRTDDGSSKGKLWIAKGTGPLSIVKAEITRGETSKTYHLRKTGIVSQ